MRIELSGSVLINNSRGKSVKVYSFLLGTLFAGQALAHVSETAGSAHGIEHLLLLLALVPIAGVLGTRWAAARKRKD